MSLPSSIKDHQYIYYTVDCDIICVDSNYNSNNFNFLETDFYQNIIGDTKLLCIIKIQLKDVFIGLYCNNNILKINCNNIVHKLVETGVYKKISSNNSCLLIDLQIYNECKYRYDYINQANNLLIDIPTKNNNIDNKPKQSFLYNISKFFGLAKKENINKSY